VALCSYESSLFSLGHGAPVNLVEQLHEHYVCGRRVRVLARRLAPLLPDRARVLDLGCGSGEMANAIIAHRPDVGFEGLDVLVRPMTYIRVRAYDGVTIPHDDCSFDAVLLVDVVHHADDPLALLREARRVARACVLVKDHTLEGPFAGATLRFMDRVGNARHGVRLPYNYWPRRRWFEAFECLKLDPGHWETNLGLYPPPTDWIFGRSLHFIARLDCS